MSTDILSKESIQSRFKEYLHEKGLSFTPQRNAILDYLCDETSHFQTEDLINSLKSKNIQASRATVYRTLTHLQEAGFIRLVSADASQSRYEFVGNTHHHEHMTCTKCGNVFEFTDTLLEQCIEDVVKGNGFLMTNHSVQIFGICRRCHE